MNGHMDVRVLNEQSLVDTKCAHFQSSSNDTYAEQPWNRKQTKKQMLITCKIHRNIGFRNYPQPNQKVRISESD